MDTNEIKSLAEIMKNNGVTSLEIEDGKVKIKLERSAAPAAAAGSAVPFSGLSDHPAQEPLPQEDPCTYITAPMVGVFYAAAAPGEPPFVKEGSIVKKTDTVCIIEAMKLMNDIAAECDGEICEILVKNGNIVEYGQKLFKVRKSGS